MPARDPLPGLAMKLLAIDTSGPLCSAALLIDGQVTQRAELAPRRHAELILPMMDSLLEEAGLELTDLAALAYGQGPGSFTGVRIAAAVVQGAAFGADRSVVGVSTLAALAQGAWRVHDLRKVICAQDARMGEVYWGAYALDDHGIMRVCGAGDQLDAPDRLQLPDWEGGWVGVGSAWAVYRDALSAGLGSPEHIELEYCEARDVAVLAATTLMEQGGHPAEQALPVYLRDRVAERPRR